MRNLRGGLTLLRDRMLIDLLRLTKPEDLQTLMQLVAPPKKPDLHGAGYRPINPKPEMYTKSYKERR